MTVATIEHAMQSLILTAVAAITPRVLYVTIGQTDDYPLVVLQKVTGLRDHALDGFTGSFYSRFQVEAWAETYKDAKALMAAIVAALDDYSGTVGTVRIGSCLLQAERDFYEPDAGAHRIIADFTVWHK